MKQLLENKTKNKASAQIEITKDGISLEGEAGAFAGLSAKASANISLLENHLKVRATASIQLGVGTKISGKFDIKTIN